MYCNNVPASFVFGVATLLSFGHHYRSTSVACKLCCPASFCYALTVLLGVFGSWQSQFEGRAVCYVAAAVQQSRRRTSWIGTICLVLDALPSRHSLLVRTCGDFPDDHSSASMRRLKFAARQKYPRALEDPRNLAGLELLNSFHKTAIST